VFSTIVDGAVAAVALRPLADGVHLLVGQFSGHLGGLAEHERSGRDLGIFGNEGLRPDDAVAPDDRVV